MKTLFKIIPVLILILIVQLTLSVSSHHEKVSNSFFKLKIGNIKQIKGNIRIAIYNTESSYLNQPKALKKVILPVNKTEITYLFKSLPKGYYAISLYQDLNSNKSLDENFFGVPTEPYGFSNNVRGVFGPPSYSDTKFYYNGKNLALTINID